MNSYAVSDERTDILRDLIKDGEDAKAVLKYADRLKAYYREQMLKAVEMNIDNLRLNDAMVEYRVACKFCYMLESAIEVGENKRETLTKILSR